MISHLLYDLSKHIREGRLEVTRTQLIIVLMRRYRPLDVLRGILAISGDEDKIPMGEFVKDAIMSGMDFSTIARFCVKKGWRSQDLAQLNVEQKSMFLADLRLLEL